MKRAAAIGLAGLSVLALAPPLHAAETRRDATQRMLDAMTRHDLCARDDAALRRLDRALAGPRRTARVRSD